MTEPLKTQKVLTGGFTAAFDKSRGVGNEDCGHDDWGYYPPLQQIYILWCRTCGTVKQSIPSEDEMEIIGARYLNPSNASRLAAAETARESAELENFKLATSIGEIESARLAAEAALSEARAALTDYLAFHDASAFLPAENWKCSNGHTWPIVHPVQDVQCPKCGHGPWMTDSKMNPVKFDLDKTAWIARVRALSRPATETTP